MHFVIRDLVLLYRAEGAQTHMQGHFSNVHALGADGIHQFRGEVQASRGRCGAAKLLGIDGLVLALILQLLGDIGRQRHFAKFVQLFIKGLGIVIECNVLVAVLHGLVYHGGQAAVAELHLRARLHPLAGAGQALPGIALDLAEQQQLADSACGTLVPIRRAGRTLELLTTSRSPFSR